MTLYHIDPTPSPAPLFINTPPPFRLLIEHGSSVFAPEQRVFTQPCLRIGRAETNTVTLPEGHGLVSRHHAEICWQGGLFWICDLGSKNATMLNGGRLKPGHRYSLRHGDSITVGDYQIGFVVEQVGCYREASNWQ